MSAPAIILVRPQMGENIGAAARAMSNFGFSELRLVAPRDGWPNKKALEMASGGASIIETAKVYGSLPEALSGIKLAYATTARNRDLEKRVLHAHDALAEIHVHHKADTQTALIFGPERTGLENDDISLCDTLITIPTSPKNSSLNLGQSVVILGYEWWRQLPEVAENPPPPLVSEPAPLEDWNGLFDQLETYLDEVNYFRVPEKKQVVWQNLRSMLLRGRFTDQEIRTLRGMLRVIWEGRKPRRKPTSPEQG